MGLVACLKAPFDSGACGWLEMNPLPSPAQKKDEGGAPHTPPLVALPSLKEGRWKRGC